MFEDSFAQGCLKSRESLIGERLEMGNETRMVIDPGDNLGYHLLLSNLDDRSVADVTLPQVHGVPRLEHSIGPLADHRAASPAVTSVLA